MPALYKRDRGGGGKKKKCSAGGRGGSSVHVVMVPHRGAKLERLSHDVPLRWWDPGSKRGSTPCSVLTDERVRYEGRANQNLAVQRASGGVWVALCGRGGLERAPSAVAGGRAVGPAEPQTVGRSAPAPGRTARAPGRRGRGLRVLFVHTGGARADGHRPRGPLRGRRAGAGAQPGAHDPCRRPERSQTECQTGRRTDWQAGRARPPGASGRAQRQIQANYCKVESNLFYSRGSPRRRPSAQSQATGG